MAHLMFEEFDAAEATTRPAGTKRGTFDQMERSVIFLSRTDPAWSLVDPQTWRMRLLCCLGYEMSNSLADARLEALRRYAVILRVRGNSDNEDLNRFLEAGFVAEQAMQLEQMVAPWKNRSHVGAAALQWSALGLVAVLFYHLVAQALDQEMIALVIIGLFFAMLAPFLFPNQASS